MEQSKGLRVLCVLLSLCCLTGSTAYAADAPDDARLIALTFDDGPSSANTTRILDILEVNGAKATFFVIGSLLVQNADATRRAQQMGCEIGNHTFGHKTWTGLSDGEICAQIGQADAAIEGVLGKRCALVRPPGGHCCGQGKLAGRPLILWSVDTEDWKYGAQKNGNSAENRGKVIRAATENIRDGDIILMHDIYAFTADCCEVIVPALRAQGFELVTVSEMIRRRGIELHSGDVIRNAR